MKGITPIISVVLLLLIVIATIGFSYMLFQRNLSGAQKGAEQVLERTIKAIPSCIRIEQISGNTVYIRNCGKGNVTDITVYLDRHRFAAKNTTNGLDIVIPEGQVATIRLPETITVPYAGTKTADSIKVSASGTVVESKITGRKITLKDFAIVSDRYNKWLYVKSNKDGSFSGPTLVEDKGGEGSWGIVVADFDMDSYYDFVSGDGNDNIYFFRNSGTNGFNSGVLAGTFNAEVSDPNYMRRAMDMASADFNNDGKMDFAVSGNNNYYTVFLGNGDGTFAKIPEFSPAGGVSGLGKDAGDIDSDGCPDLVADAKNNGEIWWFPGNCDGTFGEHRVVGSWGENASYGVMTGDFDNDGKNDVVTNPYSKHNHFFIFFRGNGDGTFEGPVIAYAHESLHDLNAGDAFDVNKDGSLDIVYVNYEGNSMLWATGVGDGTFVYKGPVTDISSFEMHDVLGIAGPRPFWED